MAFVRKFFMAITEHAHAFWQEESRMPATRRSSTGPSYSMRGNSTNSYRNTRLLQKHRTFQGEEKPQDGS
jgi:hypothetical protein